MKKNIARLLLVALLTLSLLTAVTSCGKGISGDEAKAFIGDFLAEISEGDYEAAEEFLHPDRPADLKSFFEETEAEDGVDFQAGIEIEKYTNFKSSLYNTSVGGSAYELTMKTVVGENEVLFTIEIVKNNNGYGIYNLYLNVD